VWRQERKLSSSETKLVPQQSWRAGDPTRFGDVASFIDYAWLWQAQKEGGDTNPSSVVGRTEREWLLWNLWIIAMKLCPLCCEGDAQGRGCSNLC